MLHYASRLVNPASSVTTFSSSSLREILQAAAGRAWVRQIYTHNADKEGAPRAEAEDAQYPTRAIRSSPAHMKRASHLYSTLSSPSHAYTSNRRADITSERRHRMSPCKPEHEHGYGSFSRHFKQKASIRKTNGIALIKPDQLSAHDMHFIDPGRGSTAEEFHLISKPNTSPYVKAGPIETLPIPYVPTPTSRESLYQNLLTLASHRFKAPASLPALISYHSLPHCAIFQSTQSFNLLLSLAIRHASFGIGERLLAMMHLGGFKGNVNTWKLRVRLMVRCGKWDEAWRSVMDVLDSERWRRQMGMEGQGRGMPLVVWMEFFTTMKRGAIRMWTESGLKAVEKIAASEKEKGDKGMMSVDAQRLHLLMRYAPSLTPKEYTRMPARAVYFIVWMMLRAGHLDDAMKMTRSYLSGLPPKLDPKEVRVSLDIIHLHIPWGSSKRSPLNEHYDVRQIVETFLAMHKDLRPDARTLYLLLRSLRRTTHSGTIARQAANAFCRKWGFRAESQRVRRRITTFAVKENNRDLAEKELQRASLHRFQEQTYAAQTEKLGGAVRMGHNGPLTHAMMRIYQRRGVEARRWQHLERKVRYMKRKKVMKQ